MRDLRSLRSLPTGPKLVSELEQHPDDYIVTKQRPGAFLGTSLDDYLRQRNVTQVVLTGVSTSIGVESTARSAYDLVYNVVLVVDAMTDRNTDTHRHSVEDIFPRLGETDTTANVIEDVEQHLKMFRRDKPNSKGDRGTRHLRWSFLAKARAIVIG